MGISDKDRKILWGRSGNRCALCRRALVARRTSVDDEAIVGDEAHIAARSPGGPRYGECPAGTVDGYENLILLCRVDHKKVDDQAQHFTAARLREIKAEHEAWVDQALGVLPTHAGRIDHGQLPAPEPSAETVVVPVTGTRMSAPELFVGRAQEVHAVLNGLAPGRPVPPDQREQPGAVVVSAVAGMGGVGKTTLARHAASAAVQRGWFPGGAVMVNLRGYDPPERRIRPSQIFAPLLHALGQPAAHIPATRIEQAAAYHRLLADLAAQAKPVLVVLDNISTTEQVLDLLPRQAVHRAVVTTRDTLSLPGARRVELDVLNRRESLALLRGALRQHHPHDTRVDRDRAASERLVQVCGRLPLAIEIAAALLADDTGLTPAALADDLADAATRLAALRHGSMAVAGVLELSWQQLQERDHGAARLLRLLTLDPGPDVSTAAAAALADAAESLVAAQLRTLRQAHLLHASNGRWRMHDLVRLHIHTTHADDDEHQAALTRLLNHYQTTAEAADDHFLPPSKRLAPKVFDRRLDAVAWLDTHRATLIAAVTLAVNSGRHAAAVDLAVLVCRHLTRRHYTDKDALAVARDGHAAAMAVGDDPHRQAKALNALGAVLLSTDSDQAEPFLRRARDIWQELGDHNRQAMALSNIAIGLHDRRRFDEAIAVHEEALSLYRVDGDRNQEARVSANLGRTLFELERGEEGIAQYRRAVDLYRETGNRYKESETWNSLGCRLLDRRRWGGAMEAFRCALDVHRDDEDRMGEGYPWHNLGTVLQELGRAQEAIEAYRCAVTAYRHDGDKDGEADVSHQLGLLLLDEWRWDEAVEAFRRAQALYRDAGDREGEAVAWHNLGLTLHHGGRGKAAIAAYRRALAVDEEAGNHRPSRVTWEALSSALSDDGRASEAEHARRQAKAMPE